MSSHAREETREHLFSKVIETHYETVATLWSIDFDDPSNIKVASKGKFSFTLIVQRFNPIIVISICKVGSFYFPVAKDAPVIRIGLRSFVCAVPGFVYALQFPPTCTQRIMNGIVSIFWWYAHYEDHKEMTTVLALPITENQEQFWVATKSRIEPFLFPRLVHYGHDPKRSPLAATRQSPSSYTLSCLSKATRAISISIMLGTLQPRHTKLYNVQFNEEGRPMIRAFPRISVITTVLDAMELRTEIPNEICATIKHGDRMSAKDMGFTVWTVSEDTLLDLVKILLQIKEKYLSESEKQSSTTHNALEVTMKKTKKRKMKNEYDAANRDGDYIKNDEIRDEHYGEGTSQRNH